MARFRAVLAGLGQMGRIHALALARSDSFELAAASDMDPQSLDWLKDRWPAVQVYRDPLEMVNRAVADVVVVATPPATHAAIAIAAFERGAHVLCEKPLATDLADAVRLAREAARHCKIGVVDFQLRFGLARQLVHRMIREGEIGTPLTARAWFCEPGFDGEGRDWYKRTDLGGGVLMEFGSHQIDQLRWMLGEVAAVGGSVSPAPTASGQPAEHAVGLFQFASGVLAEVTVSATARAVPRRGLEIHGESGSLRLIGERTLYLERQGEREPAEVPLPIERLSSLIDDPNESFTPPLQRLLAHLAAAMSGDGPIQPLATFDDGVQALRVIGAILKNPPAALQ